MCAHITVQYKYLQILFQFPFIYLLEILTDFTLNPACRITGVEFAALSDEEALDRVLDLKFMSRARPMDKQRLVQLLQQKGAVVAVTGDGTNDAPALNHAQVGLSMGTGTSVAKEASDITLLDDSFHSIQAVFTSIGPPISTSP